MARLPTDFIQHCCGASARQRAIHERIENRVVARRRACESQRRTAGLSTGAMAGDALGLNDRLDIAHVIRFGLLGNRDAG